MSDPLAKLDLDWPVPDELNGEPVLIRVGLFKCADHDGRRETEFAITFPADDTFEIIVALANDNLTADSWTRVGAVGANITALILAALEEVNRANARKGDDPQG